MLYYKIDVLEALKKAGYNTTRIRKEKILGESTLQLLRDKAMIGAKSLDAICDLLDMQPGEIIGFRRD